MPKASEIKRGDVVEIEGVPHVLKHLETKSPSSRGAVTLYKFRFKNLLTGLKKEVSSKGEEQFGLIDCQRVSVQFSYVDGDEYHFMDLADYTQYSLNGEAIADELLFINEETQGLMVVLVSDAPVALDLPHTVDLLIEETDPSVKGGSATARTKPARLTTGLVVQVPEHISTGDRIKVNVDERRFLGRV